MEYRPWNTVIEREDDPSEANLEVLEQQLLSRQPIDADDAAFATVINIGSDGLSDEQIEQIRPLLNRPPGNT